MSQKYADLFEDLKRAKRRASLDDLENILSELGALPTPTGRATRTNQELLHRFFSEALSECERRLTELRTGYAALKEKEKNRDVHLCK